jgi:hypothetical protein
MVQKPGQRGPAEQAGQGHLPASRGEQVLTANHQIDPMANVVHGDGELVGPVPGLVPDQQVAALLRGRLALGPEPQVVEGLLVRRQADSQADPRARGQTSLPAGAGVTELLPLDGAVPKLPGDGAATAVAAVDQSGLAQARNGSRVHRVTVALTPGGWPLLQALP